MGDFYIEILKNLQCTDAAAGAAPYPARVSGMIPGMEGEPGGVFRGRSVTFIFRYALISEKLFSSELGRYRSFGIRAFQKNGMRMERGCFCLGCFHGPSGRGAVGPALHRGPAGPHSPAGCGGGCALSTGLFRAQKGACAARS